MAGTKRAFANMLLANMHSRVLAGREEAYLLPNPGQRRRS